MLFMFQLLQPATVDAPHLHTPDSNSSLMRYVQSKLKKSAFKNHGALPVDNVLFLHVFYSYRLQLHVHV